VVSGAYARFPAAWQNLLDSGVAMTAITAVVLNIVFNHAHLRRRASEKQRRRHPSAGEHRRRRGNTGTGLR